MKELRTEEDVRELIDCCEYEDVIVFSNPSYASAFVGMSEDGRAVYDYNNMIEWLMGEKEFTDDEAVEIQLGLYHIWETKRRLLCTVWSI